MAKKFTFKTEKATGRYGCFYSDTHHNIRHGFEISGKIVRNMKWDMEIYFQAKLLGVQFGCNKSSSLQDFYV